jgi:hypothetical protein
MSESSKKLVTYESMSAYTDALKQYISNYVSDYVSENAGSGLSDNDLSKLTHSLGLPIGNTSTHTWENMCIEGHTEEQHCGSAKIAYYNEYQGENYIINGTYLNVCQYFNHEDHVEDDFYVLLIGTNSPVALTPDESETIGHATDASFIALNIYGGGEDVRIIFDIPIKNLESSGNNSNNGYEIPEYTINNAQSINVTPNTSVVANLDESGYCEIRLVPPTKPGYVYEYRIILKDEWGGYKEILFDTPWGGTLHWANDDAPYFDNEHNSSATYEINIKLHIDPNDIEYDDAENTISSCLCNLWGTYTKYRWS